MKLLITYKSCFVVVLTLLIFVQRKIPDIEMEAILKRYYAKLQYFVGSIMNIADLQRLQVCEFSLIYSKNIF